MKIPFSILFAIFLSIETFAAPVPTADVGNGLSLEVRKAKAVKKAPVRAKAPVRPKPVKKAPVKKVAPKKVAPKKVAPKKVAPKKAAPAKKVAPKKAVAKKVAPKKAVAAKKVAPKKAAVPAKKVAPKKTTVPAKKVAPKKTAVPAKKVAPKKAPTKAAPKKTAVPAKAKVAPKKTAVKSKAPAKAPVKAKVPTKSATKPTASAKPSAKPSALPKCTAAQLEARSLEDARSIEEDLLEARAGVSHPSAKGSISLFHGANTANANELANSRVNLARGVPVGDFNHRPEVPGGFYMTDSLVAAAQFACYGIPKQLPASVDVLQFKWRGSGVAVHEFPGKTADWTNFQLYNSFANLVVNTGSPFRALAENIYQNAMITGPLDGPVDGLITNNFQQYAVVDQAVADSNLTLEKHHKGILCANVPKGNKLSARLYAQGQAGNAKFNAKLAKLQAAPSCVIL
ncbi:hypothetical protein DFH09DRAFT_1369790 [Mycena vulgaris]|nr:hypothetical protein DFH09DRAFT_1369790 [Mycena vulgaris]